MEMYDDVKEHTAEGVFLTAKLYALKGSQKSIECLKGKGIPVWLLKEKDDRKTDTYQRRREYNEMK